jgi:hypothetical protein
MMLRLRRAKCSVQVARMACTDQPRYLLAQVRRAMRKDRPIVVGDLTDEELLMLIRMEPEYADLGDEECKIAFDRDLATRDPLLDSLSDEELITILVDSLSDEELTMISAMRGGKQPVGMMGTDNP